MLAGRAVVEHLHPLTSVETGWDSMDETVLERGCLPLAVTSADRLSLGFTPVNITGLRYHNEASSDLSD